uniref:Spc105-related, isoform A n=1 Tax=Drosophila melanogaster TaxID=7227 RepID=Q9VPB2_DROME|nr:Spc105-related, isoform A [Drosophila melanogaster]AAF51643.2 Spc105-related, isoform A [Drosophila melanogaster]|eukprot:NP_649259.1 Spc105-related, isoform A [Drosophila melanogaster]
MVDLLFLQLRKVPTKEDEATTTTSAIKQQIKRRISFSGKKSVREFVNTKETNNWDDSYEVSEHHAEDSSGSKCCSTGSASVARVSEHADKENIPLPSHCEREHVDLSVNLQASVDFTLLPCEMMDKSRKTSSISAVSFCMTSEERKLLQSSLSDRQLVDKTMDLISGSLVNRHQIASSVCEESSIKVATNKLEKVVFTPAVKAVSDSFMDITPLGFTDPNPAAPAPAPVATLYPPTQQSLMELEEDSIVREMRESTKNQTKTPAQKSLFMDVGETKNKTQQGAGGASFSLNVSNNRDRSPSNSFESLNSTMNFTRDESMLIPFDMISGKNISKKLNFRQLNEDLETGKIQIFPNGPKTPTTDRKAKKNRFWCGLEEESAGDNSPKKDIRSIVPRGMLNFSENMTLTPTKTSPVGKNKEKLKAADEKQKYRLSQADEMMLDNTNFLAHARLGDETQSRNTSKNSTRRETTCETSELNLEYPTLSQDFQPIPSSKTRKTDFMAEEMQLSQTNYPAIPALKTATSRRTLHLNESMDHETTKSTYVRKEISVTTQETIYEKSTTNEQNSNQNRNTWACTKTKRRATLLMQESMEEDIISPLKNLQLKPNAAPMNTGQSKVNHTLYLAEPLEEVDINQSNMLPTKNVAPREQLKARKTLLLEEPMEEEMSSNIGYNSKRKTLHLAEPLVVEGEDFILEKHIPIKVVAHQENKSKGRQTLLFEEPVEEEIFHNAKDLPECALKGNKTGPQKYSQLNQGKSFTSQSRSKARQTLLIEEPMEEDTEFNNKYNIAKPGENHIRKIAKSRQTLLLSEPLEEEMCLPPPKNKSIVSQKTIDKSTEQQRSKSRHTLLLSEPIEEEHIQQDLPAEKEDSLARQQRFKPRQTLIMAEPIEEDVGETERRVQTNITGSSTSRPRHTLLMSEPIEEELTNEDKSTNASTNRTLRSRRTILMAEPIEEEGNKSIAEKIGQFTKESSEEAVFQTSKSRQTLLMAEPIEEDVFNQSNDQPKPLPISKDKITRKTSRRHTLITAEPIEEDLSVRKPLENSKESSLTARIIQSFAEPIENALFSITDQIAKQQFSESVQTPPKEPLNYLHQKPRNTLISHETIQEDLEPVNENSSVGPLRSRYRKTLIMAEPIEEDVNNHNMTKQNGICDSLNVPQSGGYMAAKTRQSVHIPVPIEEDHIPGQQQRESEPAVKGRTTLLTESIEEDVPAQHTRISKNKSMGSKVSAEPIIEDLDSNRPEISQSVEETLPQRSQVPDVPSSRRHTLLLSEPMEEDEGIFGHNYPIRTKHQISEKLEKPEGPIHSSKNSVENEEIGTPPSAKTQQSIAMSESMDFQSPQFRPRGPDFNAITPGMSLTEFVDQEEMCKTPIHKRVLLTSHRKKLSMYQPVPIDLEANASGFGTPKNLVQLKRLPTHLTPNLPESKKRNTHLFPNSNMDIELEEDQEGSWGTKSIQMHTGTSKSRRTYTVDQLDASVQPVRDYNPVVTEMNKQGGLNMLELPRKSTYNMDLEEKPITISDVNNYFHEQKEQQRQSSERESGSSNDRTFKSYAATISKFINLTGNTTIFAAAEDLGGEGKDQPHQIDNEHLSLVSTLAEETDDDGDEKEEEEEQKQKQHLLQPEICEAQLNSMVKAGSEGSCKKCRNCNHTLSETRLSSESFVLPPRKLWDFSRLQQRLRNIRQRPSWKEVNTYWEIEEEARLSRNQDSDDSMEQTRVEEEATKWNKAALLEMCKLRTEEKDIAMPPESFFTRLKRLLTEQQPNWIFDYQRKVSQQMIFYNRQLTTIRIVVNYQIEDLVEESTISVCSIQLDNDVPTPKDQWSSREHFLNFHLSLRLPMNPSDEIEGSDETAFLKFLNGIDRRIAEVKQKLHKVLDLLAQKRARLTREANRTIVRKIVRKCIDQEPIVRLEKITFLIEIGNIEDVSFTDILRPELHLFNENIQYLPKGIPFLEAFLTDPEQYLRK